MTLALLVGTLILLIVSVLVNVELWKNSKKYHGRWHDTMEKNGELTKELISLTGAYTKVKTALGKAMQEELKRRNGVKPAVAKAKKSKTKKEGAK
jgi:hypothetical protein